MGAGRRPRRAARPRSAATRVRVRRALLPGRKLGAPRSADRAERAPPAVPQLRDDGDDPARTPTHDARDQQDARRLPPLTHHAEHLEVRASATVSFEMITRDQATTPFTLSSITAS